jgi:TRAP-type mannitol/chloroaromatic compound transport system substrate-binding protein
VAQEAKEIVKSKWGRPRKGVRCEVIRSDTGWLKFSSKGEFEVKKKRILMLLGSVCLALILAVPFVVACAGPAPSPTPTPTPSPTPTPTPSPPPEEKIYEWKLQSSWTGMGVPHQDEVCRMFVERTKEMSDGRLLITNYDAGVILSMGEGYEGCASGIVDMLVSSSGFFSGIEPVGEYFWAVPFLTEHEEFYDMIYYFLGGRELWREVHAKHNLFALNYLLSDEWGSMASTVPIRHWTDVSGLKIRSMGIHATFLKEYGASTTIFTPEEIYTAFSTGIIDASIFGSPNGWYGMHIYEVADYYIDPPFVPYDICEVVVNMDSWNELPDDLKAILEASSRLHSSEWAALSVKVDGPARAKLEDAGMEFIRIPDDEILEAKKRTLEIFLESAKIDEYCARYVDIIKEALRLKEVFYGPRVLPTE